MGSKWKEVPFNELGEVNRGRSRHRPRYAEHLYGGPYPFIQTGDVRGSGGRIAKHTQTYSEAGLKQSRLWPTDTMCITIAANIAETAILTYPACFPDSIVGFIADESKCDVRFIEYNFRLLKRRLQSEAIGSVQDNINLATLSRLNIPIPPLPEQKAIAHILGSLDDKIELNRQMNKTLEEMAQALFKSWFVNFDPVLDNALVASNPIPEELSERAEVRKKALSDGTANREIAKQFPAKFQHTEEMGWIPEGWEISCVGDEFKVIMGQSPPGNSYNESGDGIYFFQGRADFGFRFPKKRVFTTAPKRFAEKNDTLVSVRAPVGDVNMAFAKCCVGRGVCAVRHKSLSSSYSYYSMLCLREHFNTFEAEGTVFGSINQKDFKALTCIKSHESLVSQFEKLAGVFDNKIEICNQSILDLTKLRDTLLPKLISGELRIPDAEKLVEEAMA